MSILRILPPLFLLLAFSKADPFDYVARIGAVENSSRQIKVDNLDYRLPLHTKPTFYDIELIPHIVENVFTFDGEVKINITVVEPTPSLTLHAWNLTFDKDSTKLVNSASTGIKILDQIEDDVRHFYTIKFANSLPKGTYTLILKYTGILNNELYGFYRSSYLDDNGKRKWIATTHFEPVGARRAFPCWDEPAMKARFNISIKHFENYTAIANTPVAIEMKDATDGKKWTRFQTTPEMSTYLIAFVVSDYGFKGDNSFRVWTRKNKLHTVDYALNIGKKELKLLEEYTGINFTIAKMDQISIPDFDAGAMENWGLVTYRESALLYEENVTTTVSKQGVASVISHEFAHQWFGNLVSPKWWKYIWLNEGFATYFQYYTTDMAEANWRMMEQFVVKVLQGTAFLVDSRSGSRPMNYNENEPVKIRALFDGIAYQKAGSVIRMMQHFLTEPIFQQGIRYHLQAKSFDVATSDDLFAALQKAVDESKKFDKAFSVKRIMDTWVTQEGFPVLNVTRIYSNETGKMTITQKRFILDRIDAEGMEEYMWWVPINYATAKNQSFENTEALAWLGPLETLELEGFDNEDWVIVNKQQTGYYRVNYDQDNWMKIYYYLNSDNYTKIPPVTRAQLIDDVFNLARSEQLPYSLALEFSLYLYREIDYIPWVSAFSGLSFLNRVLVSNEQYPNFKNGIVYYTSNLMKNVTFEPLKKGETHVHKLARIDAVNWACTFGNLNCTKFATEQFHSWLQNSTKNVLSPDLKKIILCNGVRYSNESIWNATLEKYQKSDDVVERSELLTALGCTPSEKILKRYLELAFAENSTIKNSANVITAVFLGSPRGVDLALDFITDDFALVKQKEKGIENYKSYITEIGRRVTKTSQFMKLKFFIAREGIPESMASAGLKLALQNLNWLDLHDKTVTEWLKVHQFPQQSSAASLTIAIALLFVSLFITRLY